LSPAIIPAFSAGEFSYILFISPDKSSSSAPRYIPITFVSTSVGTTSTYFISFSLFIVSIIVSPLEF